MGLTYGSTEDIGLGIEIALTILVGIGLLMAVDFFYLFFIVMLA